MSAGAAPERLVARLDDIERALTDAEADDARLAAALAHIDPERANAELKSALREHARRPSPELDARVSALRQRHEAINDLLNQRDRLRRKIDATLLDVEQLAMRAVTLNSAADRGPASAPATVDDNLGRANSRSSPRPTRPRTHHASVSWSRADPLSVLSKNVEGLERNDCHNAWATSSKRSSTSSRVWCT
jgi:hypothetical protein